MGRVAAGEHRPVLHARGVRIRCRQTGPVRSDGLRLRKQSRHVPERPLLGAGAALFETGAVALLPLLAGPVVRQDDEPGSVHPLHHARDADPVHF